MAGGDVELGDLVVGRGEADFEAVDLAEPAYWTPRWMRIGWALGVIGGEDGRGYVG